MNNANIGKTIDRDKFVGVLEVKEIVPNIFFILNLKPFTKKILVGGDNSSTYKAIEKKIQDDRPKLFKGIDFVFFADNRIDRVLEGLKSEKQGVIVLTTVGGFFQADGLGNLPLPVVLKAIVEAGNFMVVSMEDVYVREGVLGGIVTSGPAQGGRAGEIARDFNNILSAILGFTELSMLKLPTPCPLRPNFEKIEKAGNRARDLVAQILAFSRKTAIKAAPVDLREVVEEVSKLLRATIPKNVEIKMEFSTRGGAILADSTRIHQVVMNLCTNAA